MASLADLLPREGERLTADQVLDRFVSWVSSSGLSLYPAQEEAVLELLGGKHVVLATPTPSLFVIGRTGAPTQLITHVLSPASVLGCIDWRVGRE